MDTFSHRPASCDRSSRIRRWFHLGSGCVNTRILNEIVALALNNYRESGHLLSTSKRAIQ